MRLQEQEEQRRLMQEQAIGEFNEKQACRYRLGRTLVITLCVLHILNAVAISLAVWDVFRLLFQLVPAVLMLCGIAWPRYVLATYAAVDATLVIFVVCSQHIGFEDPRYTWLSTLLVGLYVLYDAVSAALLFTNKAVGLYFYERKNHVK